MKALDRILRYGTQAYAKMRGIEWTPEFHARYERRYKRSLPSEKPERVVQIGVKALLEPSEEEEETWIWSSAEKTWGKAQASLRKRLRSIKQIWEDTILIKETRKIYYKPRFGKVYVV